MTRQQAGVSAEAVAAIRWYLDAIFWASKHERAPAENWQCNFCDGFRAHKPGCEYVIATDALNTLLATAPPEQAAQKGGATLPGATHFINPDPKQQSGEHRADSNQTSALKYANELIEDLLANEHCSCLEGAKHPCPRCIITIEEAKKYIATCTVPGPPQAANVGARSPNDEIHFQEGRLLGLTEGMHKCEELSAELQQKYDSLKFQWDSLQDHEHARFVTETECGCDSSKGVLCDAHNPIMQGAERSLMQPQPASAGALDSEIVNPYPVRCFNCGTDKPGNGHTVLLCGDCYEKWP